MAVCESIRLELGAVLDARAEADAFCRVLDLLDESSPFAHAFRCQLERMVLASDALEKTLRQRALPMLQDLERVAA